MAVITNVTFGRIKEEIRRRNTILHGIAESFDTSQWELISFDVKSGLASEYAIGSELMTKYTYNGVEYDYPWIVVDNNRQCTWEDGTTHPGLWLCAKYGSPHYIDFDAAEGVAATEETAQSGLTYIGVSGTTYTKLSLSAGDAIPYSSYNSVLKGTVAIAQVYKDGYNRYRDSALRQWLNSDDAAGEWWTATHVGDNPPSVHSTVAGFMSYISPDFLSVVNAVKVQTAANVSVDGGVTDTTYDKFFPVSLEEVYGVAQTADVEGPYFPYWKTATSLNAPSNDSNSGRIIYKAHNTSSAAAPHLRSASKNTAYNVWSISENGSISNNASRHTRNVLPCCVIS